MSDNYDIYVHCAAESGGPSNIWIAIEDRRYDVDGDSEGNYPNYAQATGNTKWEAIEALIENLREHEETQS